MNVNAVFVIIVVISAFTAIVSFVLKGKYYKTSFILSLLNLAIAIIAFVTIHFPENQCRANPYTTDCGKHSGLYLLISLFNIIFSIIIWYFAFKRQKASTIMPNTASPIANSQLQSQTDSKEGLRKFMTTSGWLIMLGIIAFVILIGVIFIMALSAL